MEKKQKDTNIEADREKGGESGEHRKFHFSVDGREVQVDTQFLTGAQIKAKAGVDPTFGLFREGHGHQPNQQINDGETVDLSEPGNNKFFTVPPATFGTSR